MTPITSPVWSVLFPKVSALITDSGGTLSHSAIIAREFGIPCVNGIQDLVQTVRDGERLTVDGHLGIVTVGAPDLDRELGDERVVG